MRQTRLIITVGFAIFAMFFGAGNLVFPLATGVHAGSQLTAGMIGFIFSGVIVPCLGLFVISLYHGKYMDFLWPIGRWPAFIVALLLIVLVGLVVGTPRTSVLAYGTFRPFFPTAPETSVLFNFLFFATVFFLSLNQKKIVDLLAYILSPMKLFVLSLVIVAGLLAMPHMAHIHTARMASFTYGLEAGYGTMDLLAGFFFCAFVYQVIAYKTRAVQGITERDRARLTLLACLIGAALLALIYLFFMIIANKQAFWLQSVPTEALIGSIAKHLLGPYAAMFVSICVTLACLSTALAVNAVTVEFFSRKLFCDRLPYRWVLAGVTLCAFIVSNLGFSRMMQLALPILSTLYPALIALTVINILHKLQILKQTHWAPLLFYGVLIAHLIWMP